ncbi:hypothetical protein ASswx1_402 [Aeromonas phage Asswx_1]|uniref:Uncharacterized protein n=1 Tax=Aeromonas phage Asswx_1 TaxID=2419739 RepID=A0A411B8W0_9CAUD|nr:hypothetical protein ASswx1_402 [Aeromonas phage Asswx_1]QAX98915.1 hypothetical protein assk_121 [Aeromonas phage Assk]
MKGKGKFWGWISKLLNSEKQPQYWDVINPVTPTPLQEKVDKIVEIIDGCGDLSRKHTKRTITTFVIGDGVKLVWGISIPISIMYDDDGKVHDIFNEEEKERILTSLRNLSSRVEEKKRKEEFKNFLRTELK